jgi:hypothetical protein
VSAQVLDGTVAVLWGSATREVNWILLSPKNGRVSVAKAGPDGFWVRDAPGVPDVKTVAQCAAAAWDLLRDGYDLPAWATHRLAPPHMQIIELIPTKDEA